MSGRQPVTLGWLRSLDLPDDTLVCYEATCKGACLSPFDRGHAWTWPSDGGQPPEGCGRCLGLSPDADYDERAALRRLASKEAGL